LVLVALLMVAIVLTFLYVLASLQDPEPDPFRMTLMVSDSEANATDTNLTDVVLWVAVANGEPKPRWSEVEVFLETPSGNVTLVPPRLRVDDQDDNGRISEGDLLWLAALTAEEANGTVILGAEGEVIGTVRL
jgi:hypothetical protein